MLRKTLYKIIFPFILTALLTSGCTGIGNNNISGTTTTQTTSKEEDNSNTPQKSEDTNIKANETQVPKTTSQAATANSTSEKKSFTIPVLMYHSIRFEEGNVVRMAKERFETQMKWLSENGYKTLTMDELFEHISGEKGFDPKSVVVTLDDGYRDNYLNAFPIFKKYNIHATIFMITGAVGHEDYLTEDQIKEMSSSGVDIEPHTVHHPDNMSALTYEKQYSELKESKEYLEKLTGKTKTYIAYPNGIYNNNTLKAIKELGYKMGFRMDGGKASVYESRYQVKRVYVGGFDSLELFKNKVAK